ncbi:MAG: metallophosphoesterase family protein, partial [Candidatus Lokiarchaeota archaeon]|nr:metallophosphoesterase family protein [Candidatus Lokiarchaeota archaeon]
MEENDASREKAPQNIFQAFVGLMAVSAGALLFLIDGIVLWFFQADLVGYEHAVFSGIAVGLGGMAVAYLFDRSERFTRRCQAGPVNLKWLVITPVVVGIAAGVFFIYLHMSGLGLDFIRLETLDLENFDLEDLIVEDLDLTIAPQRAFVIFTVVMAIVAPTCFFTYFGVKTLVVGKGGAVVVSRRSRGGMMGKSTALAALGILVIIGGGYAIDLFHSNLVVSQIRGGNGHDEGPWVTWNADPRTSACITWLTASPNSTVVRYGTNPALLDQVYSDADQVYLHKAFLQGLSPDTTYFYSIPEAFETLHTSTQFNFTTAPATPRAFKFAAFGDMQPNSPTSDKMRTNALVIDGLLQRDIDFTLQIGDIADSGADLEDWHLVLTNLARLGAHVPLQTVIGNHDWDGMAGSLNYHDLFTYDYKGGHLSQYHSFDYLNAHFVAIDNFERMYSMSNKQLEWIEQDITAAKARGQDWVFCYFHLSLMTTATSGMYQDLQRVLVPLFDRLPVDAVFYGHDHDYEHYNYTYGWNGLVYEQGHTWSHHAVQYFCTGGGGADLEVGYGVLTQGLRTDTVRWWNETAGAYQDASYQRRPWNASLYAEHP